MAWSYNHKTGKSFWTENPKYIPDPRMGEGFKETGYGFKDTAVTRKHTEYATPKEAKEAREEYLKDQQIARNKAEAEQRAYDESITWAEKNLTQEEKELEREIKSINNMLSNYNNHPDVAAFYKNRKVGLEHKLEVSIAKRAFEYRKGR